MKTKRRHQLKSLSIIGGFLDGVRIDLATGLNCIIGARGTGKTTILELIRYAMDALPRREVAASARKRIEALVDGNLEGGRIELEIETADGLHYIISRAVDEDPIVLDLKRQPTGIAVKSLFRADVFSQNEVESIADQSRYQLDLIDSFTADDIVGLNAHISVVCQNITALAREVETLTTKRATAEEEAKQLPVIEAKLAAFAGGQGNDAAVINEAHRLKGNRDREVRAVRTASTSLCEYVEQIQSLIGHAKAITGTHLPKDLLTGPNAAILTRLHTQMLASATTTDGHLNKARHTIEDFLANLSALKTELQNAHEQQELAFRELIEKHKQHQAQSAERATLERRRNELGERKREADEIARQLAKHSESHQKLITQLSELRDRRFNLRKGIADRLNRALAPNIRVTVAQDGNPDTYQRLIEDTLKGAGVQRGMIAQKLVRLLPPTQLAALVRAGDSRLLMDRGELNADQAAKMMVTFNRPTTLAELETVELLDEPTIELRDGEGYKPSTQLSTGQKCTTILPILLLESENPLLIDQPEDNLDNSFIFEAVVANIQAVKATRQLIFVTHNPNIPVLGEAERVVVMESDGEHGRKTREGTVDECKDSIVTLLEGGEEAFRKRGKRYQF
ncbi:conserved hypothetical protein [Chthoniobacter flavus Ellin428]|uniref:Rad50/SbcC-type AAA domain-containing protein n=1 Tax=Chthoniobacter flavus Ellin428 TaxID=497964 RepID=B4CXK2_9BACT|nr:AAA family ATPase [Chthoniobacter flavus]EDY21000.1 conserved hypothetical protein [Chthoniobacter flavus Ellin428]TCO88727.1 AAA domain-containing protein [Chthoniobacter flavus]